MKAQVQQSQIRPRFSVSNRKERLQLPQCILVGLQVVHRNTFLQGDDAAAYFGDVHQVVA